MDGCEDEGDESADGFPDGGIDASPVPVLLPDPCNRNDLLRSFPTSHVFWFHFRAPRPGTPSAALSATWAPAWRSILMLFSRSLIRRADPEWQAVEQLRTPGHSVGLQAQDERREESRDRLRPTPFGLSVICRNSFPATSTQYTQDASLLFGTVGLGAISILQPLIATGLHTGVLRPIRGYKSLHKGNSSFCGRRPALCSCMRPTVLQCNIAPTRQHQRMAQQHQLEAPVLLIYQEAPDSRKTINNQLLPELEGLPPICFGIFLIS
ncbi:hypothetical protein BYT27DRAFT_7218393 [Phlegmacium glaucopus]|nr:hypothetical protein BYT27DRAFT_7218393 [Phlegmacium glaucopus]